MAFFPCTRFEDQILLSFRGEQYQDKKMSDIDKLERDIILHQELHELYTLISQLMIICLRKDLKIIFENPYSEQHYLRRYWCLKPSIIDRDRREKGDYYKKPTQYFFINIKPQNNLVMEAYSYNSLSAIEFLKKADYEKIARNRQVARSMIHSDYANRFIREYILESPID